MCVCVCCYDIVLVVRIFRGSNCFLICYEGRIDLWSNVLHDVKTDAMASSIACVWWYMCVHGLMHVLRGSRKFFFYMCGNLLFPGDHGCALIKGVYFSYPMCSLWEFISLLMFSMRLDPFKFCCCMPLMFLVKFISLPCELLSVEDFFWSSVDEFFTLIQSCVLMLK